MNRIVTSNIVLQNPNNSKVYTIDSQRKQVSTNETPLGLYNFGVESIAKYALDKTKFPQNQLPKKQIFVYADSEEDSD